MIPPLSGLAGERGGMSDLVCTLHPSRLPSPAILGSLPRTALTITAEFRLYSIKSVNLSRSGCCCSLASMLEYFWLVGWMVSRMLAQDWSGSCVSCWLAWIPSQDPVQLYTSCWIKTLTNFLHL